MLLILSMQCCLNESRCCLRVTIDCKAQQQHSDGRYMRPVLRQAPSKHQVLTHSVLGVPMHKIVCRTKRIGGGFGGKETRSAFIQASIRSQILLIDWCLTACFATGYQRA